MRKLPLVIVLLFSAACVAVWAAPVKVTEWRSGLTEINEGWAAHDGDNMAWARAGFDDSDWKTVDLEDMGIAQPGWHWFRKHVTVGPDYPKVKLLLEGGEGTYELYVNGQRIAGAGILSSFAVNRPVERVFTLENDSGDFEIALRTHVTTGYSAYGLPLFLNVTMGRPTVIDYERQALESQRLYAVAPSVAINLLLMLAALGALALFSEPAGTARLLIPRYLSLPNRRFQLPLAFAAGWRGTDFGEFPGCRSTHLPALHCTD